MATFFTVQGCVDGIWDESHVGERDLRFSSREDAVDAIESLRACGPDWEEAYQRGEYRIVEHDNN